MCINQNVTDTQSLINTYIKQEGKHDITHQ